MTAVKKRIVIASVLKPLDDTRMFEKFATSLSDEQTFDVHVMGYPAIVSKEKIVFHPLKPFRRLSLQRWLASFLITWKTFQLKPKLFIITTHELLFSALLIRLFCGSKIVYDVQENYYRNILHTNAFPKVLRHIIAVYVRGKEKIAASFIDHFILAERTYADELTFVSNRFTILENKAKPFVANARTRDKKHFLFSGTLAASTGVFNAIKLVTQLHQFDPHVQLTIIGYCALPAELERIRKLTSPYIHLIGGGHLIPHHEIVEQFNICGVGIVANEKNPATMGRIPTKLFEYILAELPILLTNEYPAWKAVCDPYNAAISFNTQNPDPRAILDTLDHQQFYTKKPLDVSWSVEEPKLKSLIHSLLY